MKRLKMLTLVAMVMITMTAMLFSTAAPAEKGVPDWPRSIDTPNYEVIIYQPQLESFKGDKLTARAAVSVKTKATKKIAFGAVWFNARIYTDRDERMVYVISANVPNVKFPGAKPEQEKKFADFLAGEVPKWQLSVSLDRILANLELIKKEKKAADKLEVKPPKIVIVNYPAVLVTIDGKPKLQPVENSKVMRVINTPFLILFEPSAKKYYITGADKWVSANDIKGPWDLDSRPPQSVKQIAAKIKKDQKQSQAQSAPPPKQQQKPPTGSEMPRIFVTTEPMELIVTDGLPKYTPIKGNDLLYMSNSESDVFMAVADQQYYILLSGRWYRAKSLQSTWAYVPSNKLPKAFKAIPEDSVKKHVLAHVAGTEQAKEAVLETYVPQTSAINRKDVKLKVPYDGKPKFETVEGTSMKYAVNTSYSVLKIDKKYYCCNQAVWYESKKPDGPWDICVSVPKAVESIPPTNPVYNVKYVHVYDYTPSVVYVGYMPGYIGCYPYGGAVVYGTGYYYSPWYGAYYYPRPVTWGMSVRYNPWTGSWGFGVGVSVGWGGHVSFGIGYGGGYAHPWWGPMGYHHHVHHHYHHYGRGNYHVNARRPVNIYNKQTNIGRNNTNITRNFRTQGRKPGYAAGKQNNVFAGKNGNVYRRTNQGWQSRQKSGWGSTSKQTISKSGMNKQYKARQRGSYKTKSYNRSRSRSRSGGGFKRKR